MPRFSRFYSSTEAEALANITQLLPQSTGRAPHFANSDAKQLSDLLNGEVVYSPRSRNDFDQPAFSLPQSVQPVEGLLSISGFSISHETVHRSKGIRYVSSSEDLKEWKTRSQTSSSDEPSPSPTSSVKAETLSTSDGSTDDDLAQAWVHIEQLLFVLLTSTRAATTLGKRHHSWDLNPDYYAAHPQDILHGMDTHFSKYSYDLHEGSTAIPFVMVQAPADTHAQLVAVDRKLWAAGDFDPVEGSSENDTAAAALLERFQKTDNQRATSTRHITQVTGAKTDDGYAIHKDKSTSKRAALIEKSQASKDSLLVVGKSANQRRSAMQKNKKRRSIMPSPPPANRKQEKKPKAESPTEETRPTILILNQKEDDQRRDVDSALQDRRLDFDNTQHLQELMKKLGEAMTEKNGVSEGQKVEEDLVSDGNTEDQARKTRLKGEARGSAKRQVAP
ncbi:hypothetical protein N0V95_001555 [Ascochyta clinopodiicola]|nr:hypothetical protein N0V95_001555 [Ascochyta clinopodiicola]